MEGFLRQAGVPHPLPTVGPTCQSLVYTTPPGTEGAELSFISVRERHPPRAALANTGYVPAVH